MSASAGVAPWIERLARVGYAAKAVLYGTIGILAAQVALGQGGRTTDTRGALRELLGAPFGRVMLYVMAAGLLGYTAWMLVRAVADPEGKGRDFRGIAARIRFAASGLIHGALGLAAFRLARGLRTSGGDGTEQAASGIIDLPAGGILLWVAAIAITGYGLYQFYRAFKAKLGRDLALGELPAGTARWVVGVSRFGIAARGVVFGMIGVFFIRAASRHDAREAGGLDQSLRALSETGRWPFLALSLGLVAYGVYELVTARYRRIRVDL